MRVFVTVHPSSREVGVEKQDDGSYVVRVKAHSEGGKANLAVIKLLSKHFKKDVRIVSGLTSRHKTLEVS